jgi:hypothetical protein
MKRDEFSVVLEDGKSKIKELAFASSMAEGGRVGVSSQRRGRKDQTHPFYQEPTLKGAKPLLPHTITALIYSQEQCPKITS